MIANLRENLKDAPKFLTVPISEWYAPRFFFSFVVAFLACSR